MKRISLLLVATAWSFAQTVEMTTVAAKPVARSVDLPGELAPYLAVALSAKIDGYVEDVRVDRGSAVGKGDPLVELSAPELQARIRETEAQVSRVEAGLAQAEAQAAALESTYERLKKA